MPFEAIVHAPALRVGARLNIAESNQVEGTRPARLCLGADVDLRIGCCSPYRACGRITGLSSDANSAVLTVGADAWSLHRGDRGGVSLPGLVSEIWYVTAKGHPSASPVDHSIAHSGLIATTEG